MARTTLAAVALRVRHALPENASLPAAPYSVTRSQCLVMRMAEKFLVRFGRNVCKTCCKYHRKRDSDVRFNIKQRPGRLGGRNLLTFKLKTNKKRNQLERNIYEIIINTTFSL